MLINFTYLLNKYSIKPKGIIHLGANEGQELEEYSKNGVENMIWVEALPDIYFKLVENLKPHAKAMAINECLSDVDGEEVTFNISSNNGESSSMLNFGLHSTYHPDVTFVNTIKLKTKTLKSIFDNNGSININNYDFLNIDLQGVELKAMKGMGDYLKNMKWIYTEVNEDYLYADCCLVSEIDAFLKNFGFERVETSWTNNKWGDALYIKR